MLLALVCLLVSPCCDEKEKGREKLLGAVVRSGVKLASARQNSYLWRARRPPCTFFWNVDLDCRTIVGATRKCCRPFVCVCVSVCMFASTPELSASRALWQRAKAIIFLLLPSQFQTFITLLCFRRFPLHFAIARDMCHARSLARTRFTPCTKAAA